MEETGRNLEYLSLHIFGMILNCVCVCVFIFTWCGLSQLHIKLTSQIAVLHAWWLEHQFLQCLAIHSFNNRHHKDVGQPFALSLISKWLARSLADIPDIFSIHKEGLMKLLCWSYLIQSATWCVQTSRVSGIVSILGNASWKLC